MEMFLDVAS